MRWEEENLLWEKVLEGKPQLTPIEEVERALFVEEPSWALIMLLSGEPGETRAIFQDRFYEIWLLRPR